MKKCKNCGAYQSDDHSVCLDCGSVLGRPMTEEEEAKAEQQLDDRLDDMAERTDDFYVPLRDKIMGILCIVGIIAAFVLIGLAGDAKDAIRETIPDDFRGMSVTYYVTGEGYSTSHSNGMEDYSTHFRRMDDLDHASLCGVISILSLIMACSILLFPRFMWNISTLRYRIFYNWDTTPSDLALIFTKVITYFLFGAGFLALLWGWLLYL